MDLDVYGGRKKAMTSLKHQAVSGVKWSAVSQVSRQGTQLLTTIILAHLLTPSDFGLVGMAMVVIGFIGIFKDLGTSAAIIQRKVLSERLLSSIFWVNVGFGTLAMAVLFLGAPLGGAIYHEPRVIAILRILSLSFFISGLSILQQALLERSLAFDTLAKVEIISVLCGAVVGIGLAVVGAGVWSLVFQSLTTVSVTTVLLWLFSSWRPKRIFYWQEVKSVSSYSLNLVGFSIFNYFARNADYLLIGRYLGALELGYYTLAYRTLLFPLRNISAVIGRVMFPVYSAIQDDNRRFSYTYLKVASSIALITFPMMMGVLALAKPFVILVFGTKWLPVIPLLMILAPVGMIQSVGTTVGAIYQAKGRTDWMFRWGVGASTFIVVAFMLGVLWGVTGVAIAYATASFILFYPNFVIPFRLIDLEVAKLLKVLSKPFINSFFMFAVIVLFRMVLSSRLSDIVGLLLSAFLGIATYAGVSWMMMGRGQLKELWGLTGFGRTKHLPAPK